MYLLDDKIDWDFLNGVMVMKKDKITKWGSYEKKGD